MTLITSPGRLITKERKQTEKYEKHTLVVDKREGPDRMPEKSGFIKPNQAHTSTDWNQCSLRFKFEFERSIVARLTFWLLLPPPLLSLSSSSPYRRCHRRRWCYSYTNNSTVFVTPPSHPFVIIIVLQTTSETDFVRKPYANAATRRIKFKTWKIQKNHRPEQPPLPPPYAPQVHFFGWW